MMPHALLGFTLTSWILRDTSIVSTSLYYGLPQLTHASATISKFEFLLSTMLFH